MAGSCCCRAARRRSGRREPAPGPPWPPRHPAPATTSSTCSGTRREPMNLTNEDVADILALLDSLPYDELDLQTPRFRLILRRTPDGWTQSTEILPAEGQAPVGAMSQRAGYDRLNATSRGGGDDTDETAEPAVAEDASGLKESPGAAGREVVGVRAPLPGTFYRAPRPG